MLGTFLNTHPFAAMLEKLPAFPYPVMSDRAAWEAVDAADRADLLALYESCREPYPMLTATQFLGFVRSGSRKVYETPYFYRRRKLIASALHCCLTGTTQALDDVVDGLWCILEESSWVISAHNINPIPGSPSPAQKPLPDPETPYIDLFAAQTGMVLAHISAMLGDALDSVAPILRRRVSAELRKRLLEPFMSRDDYWWMGFLRKDLCNWTPWIVSNILFTAAIELRDKRLLSDLCDRACRMLDRWIAVLPEDGGLDEGTGYFNMAGGSLLDCLQLLERITDGRMQLWEDQKLRNILTFPLVTRLEGGWFINFADCDARPQLCGERLQLAGEKLGIPALVQLGLEHRGMPSGQLSDVPHLTRLLDRLFHPAPAPAAQALPPRDHWLPQLELRVYQQDGFILCAKGGHNGEAHNHNDVGSFILFVDGEPQVVDAGNMVYTAKTFSDERYTLMNTRSAYHNLPMPGGCEQQPGTHRRAAHVQRLPDGLSLELAQAYAPEAGVTALGRSLRLTEGGFALQDEIRLERAEPVTWVFMLRHEPVVEAGVVTTGKLRMAADSDLCCRVEEIPVTDPRMAANYPGSLWRLLLTAPAAKHHHRSFRLERA